MNWWPTVAQLVLALVRDPEEDTYADYSNDIIINGKFRKRAFFHGNRQTAHILLPGTKQVSGFAGYHQTEPDFQAEIPRGRRLEPKMGNSGAAPTGRTYAGQGTKPKI